MRVSNSSHLAYCLRKFVDPDFSLRITDIGLGNFNPFVVLCVLAEVALAYLGPITCADLPTGSMRETRGNVVLCGCQPSSR